MSHTAFRILFPEIAEKETRVINIISKKVTGLPLGVYAFMEYYCTDLDCDCRNVFIHVMHLESGNLFAIISYGWESIEFYKDWMYGEDNEFVLNNFKGPALAAMQRQSQFANGWLEMFKEIIDTDKDYADRLERHYHLVKTALGNKKLQIPD